jgi:hypothetical protein
LQIIEPLSHKAKEQNHEVQMAYSKMINKFTKAFANEFCKDDGEIDWEKIVELNSSIEPQKIKLKLS